MYLSGVLCNPHAKRLYDDLLHDYNRLIRPVPNFTETLTVRLGLKLSQLIDVDLKNQVMTTNVWVDQVSIMVIADCGKRITHYEISGGSNEVDARLQFCSYALKS